MIPIKYIEAKSGRRIVVRLPHGKDLLDVVKTIAQESKISSASLVAIGAFQSATLSYYNQETKQYEDLIIDKPTEISSCIGNISNFNDELIVHCHVVLTDSEGKAIGGHLMSGTKIFAGELVIDELLGANLERKYDDVTGLNLWKTNMPADSGRD